MFAVYVLIGLALGFGLWLICSAKLFHDASFSGSKSINRIQKWQDNEKDVWNSPILKTLNRLMQKFVFLDQETEERLSNQLDRAGLSLTPAEFTSRKYVIVAFAAIGVLFCSLMKFWVGIVLVCLLAVFLVMKQKDVLSSRLKEKDAAIAMEMPRFVRTICRTLRSNRDLYAAIDSYRKVSGKELGLELDILMAHIRTGGVPSALQQFQKRIGTEDAFRLCSTLQEIDRGIDQSATLDYLADDMARQAKYRIEKALALRPAKMRRTYLPAVGVCVVLIIYVLIVFVTNQLNNLL